MSKILERCFLKFKKQNKTYSISFGTLKKINYKKKLKICISKIFLYQNIKNSYLIIKKPTKTTNDGFLQ